MKRRTFLKLAGATTAVAALGRLPWALAQAGAGARDLIVASSAGDADAGVAPSVSIIDPGTYEVLATLPFGDAYSFPATRWDFERDLVWTGLPAGPNDAVRAFRLSTGEQVLEHPTGSSQNYTEITPDGRHVIVAARFADRYLRLGADPDADGFGEVQGSFDTYEGASPCDMTIHPDGTYAYAPDRGGDTLTVVGLEPFERLEVIPMERFTDAPLEPYMATVSPAGTHLFVENAPVEGGSQAGSESIFDLSDPARPVEVARLGVEEGLGRGPITSEFTPDGRYGIVICRDSSELSIVDTRSLEVVQSVALPEGAAPLTGTFAHGPEADTFFVPLPGRDAVAAVTVPGFEVARLIPVGPRPMGVVYLRASVPERAAAGVPLGAALASGRTFPAGCPDRCCGPV